MNYVWTLLDHGDEALSSCRLGRDPRLAYNDTFSRVFRLVVGIIKALSQDDLRRSVSACRRQRSTQLNRPSRFKQCFAEKNPHDLSSEREVAGKCMRNLRRIKQRIVKESLSLQALRRAQNSLDAECGAEVIFKMPKKTSEPRRLRTK